MRQFYSTLSSFLHFFEIRHISQKGECKPQGISDPTISRKDCDDTLETRLSTNMKNIRYVNCTTRERQRREIGSEGSLPFEDTHCGYKYVFQRVNLTPK